MSNSYYYLIACLPYLSFHKPQAISILEFSLRCNSYLKKYDFEVIESIISGNPNKAAQSLKVVSEWLKWDMELRVELAGLRAKAKGLTNGLAEPLDAARLGAKTSSYNLENHNLAMDIFSAASPLDADELLELARWRRLELLEYGEYFNLEWLALYCLKLQIMERRGSFDMRVGMGRVNAALTAAKDRYGVYHDEGVSNVA